MSITQDPVQLQTLEAPLRPFLDVPPFVHSQRRLDIDASENLATASSASHQIAPVPALDNLTDADIREPLKEVTSSVKGNQELAEQEQNDDQDVNGDNSDKLNDYVGKVLDKIIKQRGKINKLNATLDKKGLLAEKRTAQELDENNHEEEDEEVEDCSSKENHSPTIQSKPEPAVDLKTMLANAAAQKIDANFNVEDVLEISRNEIYYGTRFPGQVVEEHLDIVNKSGHDFVVQIIVSCLNEELLDTDEYVYSVRRSHLYDYNDKHYLIMAPYSCAAFKFALKVPNMRIKGKILGQVKVSIQGVSGSLNLNLSADATIPKIFCPKELKCNGVEYPVIKLAVKEGKKQEMKIPFKNNGDVPVTMELEFHDPKDGAQEKPAYDCLVHPNVITIAPNSSTLASILVKPYRTMKGAEKPKPSRKILTGRVRDSALVYSFVFWIEIY